MRLSMIWKIIWQRGGCDPPRLITPSEICAIPAFIRFACLADKGDEGSGDVLTRFAELVKFVVIWAKKDSSQLSWPSWTDVCVNVLRKVILFLSYIQCFIVFFYMFRVPITFVSLRNRFLVILFFILVYFIYCIVVSLLFFSPTNRTLYCKCIFPFPILITS